MAESGASQSRERRKLHQRCGELGLSREERMALAEYVLRRELTSFSQIDESQVLRLLDCIEGYELISELFAQRPPVQAAS